MEWMKHNVSTLYITIGGITVFFPSFLPVVVEFDFFVGIHDFKYKGIVWSSGSRQ